MEPAILDDRAVLAISGPQARDFLQGLVTNDIVNGLAPGTGLYTALLSPQGKILFDFLVTEGDGALLLDVAREARGADLMSYTISVDDGDRSFVLKRSDSGMQGAFASLLDWLQAHLSAKK